MRSLLYRQSNRLEHRLQQLALRQQVLHRQQALQQRETYNQQAPRQQRAHSQNHRHRPKRQALSNSRKLIFLTGIRPIASPILAR